MRISIVAVGRLRAGPEKSLLDDYLTRFDRTGRALGLGPARVIEVEDKKNAGMGAEAALLRKALPKGAVICTLDERGRVMSSPVFESSILTSVPEAISCWIWSSETYSFSSVSYRRRFACFLMIRMSSIGFAPAEKKAGEWLHRPRILALLDRSC